MDELRILSTTGILGYGFPEESFKEAMRLKPHVIAADAGSTDPGPYYLGSGKSFTDRNAVKRDLIYMIKAGIENHIPVIIGTAGGSGADVHLLWNIDIIREIAKENGLTFNMGIIHADVDKNVIKKKLKDKKVYPIEPVPFLKEEDIDDATHIVGQMGVEPYIKALENNVDVIVAGRSYDPAVFAALAIKEGFDRGLSIHLGKILECGAIAAIPGSGSDCLFGILGKDYFKVKTLSDKRKCTTLSIAAHTLYEKSNPIKLPGPGGILDLTDTTFEQFDDNTVIVKGSKFIPSEKYTVKLEGAKKVGYRTVSIAACKDPVMIDNIDSVIEGVRDRVKNNFESFGIKSFFLDFKLYGKNGVMGMFENIPRDLSSELCIIIEAVAKSQEESNTICSFARSTLLHFGYEGRKSTAGNLAFPFSPSDFSAGEVYVFSIYHLMEVDDPTECFLIEIKECQRGNLL